MSNQDDKNLLDDKNVTDTTSTPSNSTPNGGKAPPKAPPKKAPSKTQSPKAPPKKSEVKPEVKQPPKAPTKKTPKAPPKKAEAGVGDKVDVNNEVKTQPTKPPKKPEVKEAKVDEPVNSQDTPTVDAGEVDTPSVGDNNGVVKDKPKPPKAPSKKDSKTKKETPKVDDKVEEPKLEGGESPTKRTRPSRNPKPPKKSDGNKPLDNKASAVHVPPIKKDKEDINPDRIGGADNLNKKQPPARPEPPKKLKKDEAEKLKGDDKPQEELKKSNLTREEAKEAKRLEKERLKREKERIKEEQKKRKELNEDKKEFGTGQALKGTTSKNAKSGEGDINQKKKGKKKWLLLLLLLLLLFILIFFLIWGDDILNPQDGYYIEPTGNIVEIKPNVEGWALEDCRFMAGDTIYFMENLYLLLPRVNDEGKYNNMCSFRFRVLLETDEEVFSDCIDYINEKGNTTIKYYRGYWYYYGIILPDNQIREIISSITFKRTLGNNVAGKLCTLRFELETVYPSGEEIDNTFGACPGDWRFGIEEYYLELINEGWR